MDRVRDAAVTPPPSPAPHLHPPPAAPPAHPDPLRHFRMSYPERMQICLLHYFTVIVFLMTDYIAQAIVVFPGGHVEIRGGRG